MPKSSIKTSVIALIIPLFLSAPPDLSAYFTQNGDDSSILFKDCYELVKNGEFALDDDGLLRYLQPYQKQDEKIYLEALRESLVEWLVCERVKLSFLSFSDEEASQGSAARDTDPKNVVLLLEGFRKLRSLEETRRKAESRFVNGGYVDVADLLSKAAQEAAPDPEELSGRIEILKDELDAAMKMPKATANNDAIDDAFLSLTHSLVEPSHDYFFWKQLAGGLKQRRAEIDNAYGIALTAADDNDARKEYGEMRSRIDMIGSSKKMALDGFEEAIQKAERHAFEAVDEYQILTIEVNAFGRKVTLGAALDELYPDDSPISSELLSMIDGIAVPLVRQALANIEKRNRKAIEYFASIKTDDLLEHIKIKRLRELVVYRLGGDFAAIGETLLKERMSIDLAREKKNRNFYVAGAAISLLGMIAANVAWVPAMAVMAVRVSLVGSAVVMAGVSRELADRYLHDYRNGRLLINSGVGGNVESLQKALDVASRMKMALVSWAFAAVGMACTVKAAVYTSKVLQNAQARGYDLAELLEHMAKARNLAIYTPKIKYNPAIRQLVLSTNRLLTLSRNSDRVVGVFRRWVTTENLAGALSGQAIHG